MDHGRSLASSRSKVDVGWSLPGLGALDCVALEAQWPTRSDREEPDAVAEQRIDRWLPASSAGTHLLGLSVTWLPR